MHTSSTADRVSFICFSRAAPQGSKRHIGGGVLIESSKRVKPFRSDLQGVAIEATPVDWDLGLQYHLRVDFHFRRPKSHLTSKGALTKAAPLFPTGRQIGDTDKLIRSVCDALTGVTWYDDSVKSLTSLPRSVSLNAIRPSSPSHQSMSELTKALIQFHKDVDKIDKNARANYGKFADLANVLSTVTPALIKNGLVLTQYFSATQLCTSLRHVSGEVLPVSACDLVLSEGRNKTQEWGKAVTYQRRYAICSILGIVADMDMDGAMLEESTKQPDLAKPAPKSKPKPAAKNPVAKKAAVTLLLTPLISPS